jgi:3',5'-cyclic-AMP phosphodiesterase
VIAGDVSDEGYPDQYELAREQLAGLACERVVIVPGNHDARHVGCLQFERIFGTRDVRLRRRVGDTDLVLVAVDSSKPDIDEGEIGRERDAWNEEGFSGPAGLRVFVCHHHLMPIPGTGRERNQVLDAGDVLALLRRCTCRCRDGTAAVAMRTTDPGPPGAGPNSCPVVAVWP